MIVFGFGALGGVCMPLITLAQALITGTRLGPAFASGPGIAGWVLGIVIFGGVGSLVAWGVEKSPPHLKALVIGLTLPATLTALGHGSAAANGLVAQSSWGIVSSAWAQEKPAVGAEKKVQKFVVINYSEAACNVDCRVIFFGEGGKLLSISSLSNAEHVWAKPIPVPAKARTVGLLTGNGSVTPTELPTNFVHGTATVSIEHRSLFLVGLTKALGWSITPYKTTVNYEGGSGSNPQ